MMRGVFFDLDNKGAKASTTMAGPITLVNTVEDMRSDRDPSYSPVTAALLTNASMLRLKLSERRYYYNDDNEDDSSKYKQEGERRLGGIVRAYRPYLAWTCFTAWATLSSEATSSCMKSAVPGKASAFTFASAASPFSCDRLPSKTVLETSERSRQASAKPIPPFAGYKQSFSIQKSTAGTRRSPYLPPVIKMIVCCSGDMIKVSVEL